MGAAQADQVVGLMVDPLGPVANVVNVVTGPTAEPAPRAVSSENLRANDRWDR